MFLNKILCPFDEMQERFYINYVISCKILISPGYFKNHIVNMKESLKTCLLLLS